VTDLTADTFAQHEGTTFTLLADEGTAPLVLASVERGAPTEGAPREPFSLWFTSPPEVSLPQGTYALEHEALGRLDVFLCPREPERGGPPRYEAIFN
jgi:hypothetical protein